MTFGTMLSTMSEGMVRTLGIFILTLIFSLPLGMVVALLRKSRFGFIRGFISAYISIMRGTPLMLQLLVLYFGPFYLFGWNIGNWRFPALIIGFVVN
jgi:His/Glu/Gln/Arg/opine family amino acid ABC transporter permease subunit